MADVAERRKRERRKHENSLGEIARILFPILLAAGVSYFTARNEALNVLQTELAIVKTTEETHFQELQRVLQRIERWIERQEQPKRDP